jgi:hypothetical protein
MTVDPKAVAAKRAIAIDRSTSESLDDLSPHPRSEPIAQLRAVAARPRAAAPGPPCQWQEDPGAHDRPESPGDLWLRYPPASRGQGPNNLFAATRPLVRLIVASLAVTFDSATRNVVRYEGRVQPTKPEGGRLVDLDARVDDTMIVPAYR